MTSVRIRISSLACLLVVAGMVATSCSGADPAGTSPSSSPRPTAASPVVTSPSAAAVVDANVFPTRWPIKHVVFLIKENRTFDNLFGTFPGARGVTSGFDHGVRRPLTRGTDQATHEDIPHCYECALAAWNHGAMDGFNQSEPADRWAYTQLHKDQLPNYWEWASHNALFDNFFASAQGPSFPNHLYSIAAQSGGAHDNPRRKPGLGSLTFGCDAPRRTARGGRRLRGSRRRW